LSDFNIPSSSFKFSRFNATNLREIHNIMESNDLAVDLPDGKPGFFDCVLQDNVAYGTWRDIVTTDQDILKDGKVQREAFTKIEDAFFGIFKGFAITCGKPGPLKIGEFTLTKAIGIEFRSAHISPARILELSEHMSRIQAIDFDKIQHPVFKTVKLNGQIETMADIAPFHNFTENIKSVKGVMNTPDGARSIKMSVDGRIQVAKKKDEDLSEEFFVWLFKFIYSTW